MAKLIDHLVTRLLEQDELPHPDQGDWGRGDTYTFGDMARSNVIRRLRVAGIEFESLNLETGIRTTAIVFGLDQKVSQFGRLVLTHSRDIPKTMRLLVSFGYNVKHVYATALQYGAGNPEIWVAQKTSSARNN